MKTFKVASGHRYNPIVQAVQLNGVSPDERLTPKLARRACSVAIGLRYGATVWDENGIGYALYKRSARKLKEKDTMKRVTQVNWINELGVNIAENLGEGSAEELVEYALSDEGRESWGITIPAWFDDHDYSLLIECVNQALSA